MVLAVDGSGRATRDKNTIGLTTAARIETGAKIRAREDARVDLMLLPGVLVELAGAGELEIKQLHLARNGDETIHPMAMREASVCAPCRTEIEAKRAHTARLLSQGQKQCSRCHEVKEAADFVDGGLRCHACRVAVNAACRARKKSKAQPEVSPESSTVHPE